MILLGGCDVVVAAVVWWCFFSVVFVELVVLGLVVVVVGTVSFRAEGGCASIIILDFARWR